MIAAHNAKITKDFNQAYPEFQQILEKYTPSAIFRKSVDLSVSKKSSVSPSRHASQPAITAVSDDSSVEP